MERFLSKSSILALILALVAMLSLTLKDFYHDNKSLDENTNKLESSYHTLIQIESLKNKNQELSLSLTNILANRHSISNVPSSIDNLNTKRSEIKSQIESIYSLITDEAIAAALKNFEGEFDLQSMKAISNLQVLLSNRSDNGPQISNLIMEIEKLHKLLESIEKLVLQHHFSTISSLSQSSLEHGDAETIYLVASIIIAIILMASFAVSNSIIYKKLAILDNYCNSTTRRRPKFTSKLFQSIAKGVETIKTQAGSLKTTVELLSKAVLVVGEEREIILSNSKARSLIELIQETYGGTCDIETGCKLDDIFKFIPSFFDFYATISSETKSTTIRYDNHVLSFDIVQFSTGETNYGLIVIDSLATLDVIVKSFQKSITPSLNQGIYSSTAILQSAKFLYDENLNIVNKFAETKLNFTSAIGEMKVAAELAGDLSDSIDHIGNNIVSANSIASNAVKYANNIKSHISNLTDKAERIGQVIDIIMSIASQINLLSLNANIEAARAGEAGKGFAVVANEVKALADQTTKASEEVAEQISDIQGATNEVVESISDVIEVIQEISKISSSISSIINEKSAYTHSIAKSVGNSYGKFQAIAESMKSFENELQDSSNKARKLQSALDQLKSILSSLEGKAKDYMELTKGYLEEN